MFLLGYCCFQAISCEYRTAGVASASIPACRAFQNARGVRAKRSCRNACCYRYRRAFECGAGKGSRHCFGRMGEGRNNRPVETARHRYCPSRPGAASATAHGHTAVRTCGEHNNGACLPYDNVCHAPAFDNIHAHACPHAQRHIYFLFQGCDRGASASAHPGCCCRCRQDGERLYHRAAHI